MMNLPLGSRTDASSYCGDVIDSFTPPHVLNAINQQLHKHAPRLFSDEAQAALDFLDLGHGAEDFWPSRIKDLRHLNGHLGASDEQNLDVYRCRFLFVHAAHSREKLKISRDMLISCFKHFRVMPQFTAFLFSFGYRTYAQDFHFSGFRQRIRLAETTVANPVNPGYQLCYNLKSVERSNSDEWSIRHCAVHHAFDVKRVHTDWIIIKGDELMKERIESALGDRGFHLASDFDSISRAFQVSLDLHLILGDWSVENWRWYINSLENKFQDMTRKAYSAPVRIPIRTAADTNRIPPMTRTDTQRMFSSIFSLFSRTPTQTDEKSSPNPTMKQQSFSAGTYTNTDTGITQPLPPDDSDSDDDDNVEDQLNSSGTRNEEEAQDFSFPKLRKIHGITEKANEAVLVLKHNVSVLGQMQHFYDSLPRRKHFPKDLVNSFEEAIDDFKSRVEVISQDMEIQMLRLETLIRLLEGRQTLLHSILDFQNTTANKYSTQSMYTMTEDMNDIARKTKIETVSMKVITLVTMFFLPGTFISITITTRRQECRLTFANVSQTLMSTDIFQTDYKGRWRPNPYIQLNPIQIYLALSLPLTVVTLLFWAAFHFWEKRQEKQKKSHHKAAGWQV